MITQSPLINTLSKHSPIILTWVSVLGVFATMATTHRAAIDYSREVEDAEDPEYPLEVSDKIKIAAKHYVRPGILAATTISSIFANHYVNSSRQAALLTAYSLLTNAFGRYEEAVISTVGKRKRELIRSKMSDKDLEKDPPPDLTVSPGDVLCFDSLSGRYFSSNVVKIERAINQFNKELTGGLYMSLNDFYSILGLESIGIGDNVGWMSDGRLLECLFHSKLRGSDGQPCLVLDYQSLPGPYNY